MKTFILIVTIYISIHAAASWATEIGTELNAKHHVAQTYNGGF